MKTTMWAPTRRCVLGAALATLVCGAPAAIASGTQISYVAVSGDTVMMSGDMHDLAKARSQSRVWGGADILWFRHGGKEYVVRDPAITAELRRLHAPENALSLEQDALGREQDRLSSRQEALGARQEELERRMDAIADHEEDGAERPAVTAERTELSGRLDALSRDQSDLSQLEDELSRKEEALSGKEEELSRAIERDVQTLLADVVSRGIAEAVR
jgi:DNA repair exonuclease SbcCD ATPase subunit